MNRKRLFIGCGMALGVAALTWLGVNARGGGEQRHSDKSSQAIPVLTAKARTRDVAVVLDGVGTVRAYKTVTVRPQVGGKLLSVDFSEGQHVDKGDLLARIDPVTYKAQLEQAEAQLAQDRASLASARQDLKRYASLAKTNYVSKQKADQARATVRQDEARVKADKAAVASARATLSYTTINAPISGRTGIRQVDEGNIVNNSADSAIVVITQIQPIAVVFTLPSSDIRQVSAAAAKKTLPVTVLGANSRQVLDKGRLEVINNQVNQGTGTIKLKAVTANAEQQLWPGEFVNARLRVDTLENATVVPAAAVQQGPNGAFVYTLGAHDKAQIKPVRVKQQNQSQSVIAEGVKPGERVITTGFGQLTDGAKVRLAERNGTGGGKAQDGPG